MANKKINEFTESVSPTSTWYVLVDDGTGTYYKVALTNLPGGGGGLTQLATPTLTATVISSTQIDLSWTNVANESSYKLEWSADGISGWTQIGGTIAADTLAYSHTGLTPSTAYYYRISAVGDGVTYSDSGYGTDNDTTSSGTTYVTWFSIDADLEVFNTSQGIRKISGQPAQWADVAWSDQQLSVGQRLVIELGAITSYAGIGLNAARTGDISTPSGWTFGLLTYPTPTISQYESATEINSMGSAGTSASDSWWCIWYENSTTMKYQKSTDNGATWSTQFTSAVTPTGSYYIGFDGFSPNAPFNQVKITS